jgi:hypothetical protein
MRDLLVMNQDPGKIPLATSGVPTIWLTVRAARITPKKKRTIGKPCDGHRRYGTKTSAPDST